MLKIHELFVGGVLTAVHLRVAEDGSGLEIVDESGALPLPAGALEKVFARYAAPFDAGARVTEVAELGLGGGRRLRHVRHLAGYDVVPRDYLVLDAAQGEPSCVHGATVAAPLLHLARALASRQATKV